MDPYRKNSVHLGVLVSIASIEVKSIAGPKKEGKIYGEVMIEGSAGLSFIYNRSWSNPETKFPGDSLTLTGPSSPVSCTSETVVYLSLYDEEDDHEIAVGQFLAYFLGWAHDKSKFNRPLVMDFGAKYGSVSVTYSAIEYGLYAAIKVFLNRRQGDSEVYGKIVACQYFGEVDQRTSMTLFDRSVDEAALVAPGEPLPLNRSLVEAPVNDLGSCLTVEMDLWVGDVQIAEGSFNYYVEYDGVYDPETPITNSFAGGQVILSITSVSHWQV